MVFIYRLKNNDLFNLFLISTYKKINFKLYIKKRLYRKAKYTTLV
jgi:hypothetical protein